MLEVQPNLNKQAVNLLFNPESGGNMFLKIFGTFLPFFSHSGRQNSSNHCPDNLISDNVGSVLTAI
jgi:hypothetical protein